MTATQLPLNIGLRDDASFANFYDGGNAALLESLAAMVQRASGQCYLWGSDDCGKSHLLQACGHVAAELQLSYIYIPLQEYLDFDVAMLQGMADYQIIAFDDLHLLQLPQHRHWLEALFHLYNQLRDKSGLWLAAANCSPRELNLGLADLQSRLQWGEVFALQHLDDEQKKRCLQQRGSNRGLVIDDDVAAYIMARLPRDMAALMRFLETLDQASLQAKRRITIPFVGSLLGGEV